MLIYKYNSNWQYLTLELAEFFFVFFFVLFLIKNNFFFPVLFFRFSVCLFFSFICEFSRQTKKKFPMKIVENKFEIIQIPNRTRNRNINYSFSNVSVFFFSHSWLVCLYIFRFHSRNFSFFHSFLKSSSLKASHYRMKIKIFFLFLLLHRLSLRDLTHSLTLVKRWLTTLGVMIFQSSTSSWSSSESASYFTI